MGRTEQIHIRCTKGEKRILQKEAETYDTTISEYVLSKALKQSSSTSSMDCVILTETINQMLRLISKSGNEILKSEVQKLLEKEEAGRR